MKPFLFCSLLLLLLPLFTGAQQPAITPRGMALPVVSIEEVQTTPIGARVAEVNVTDASGKNWLLSGLRGKVVFLYCFTLDSIVNSGAAKEVNYLADKYADSSAIFLALTPDAFAAMEQCGGAGTVLKCPAAYRQGEALERLAVTSFPAVVMLNKKGRIVLWQDAVHSGGLAEQEATLRRLLRK